MMTLSEVGGCTANVVLVKNGKLYNGNVGDSRAIAYTTSSKTIELS